MIRIVFFVSIFFLLTGCLSQPINEQQLSTYWQIIESKTQRPISFTMLLKRLSGYQYILIGEEHNVAAHHQIEQYLIQQLAKREPLSGVVFEMFEVEQQAAISATQSQAQQLSPAQIKTAIQWRKWDWNLYKDLIVISLKSTTPVLAANLSEVEIQQLMAGAAPLNGSVSVTPLVRTQLGQLIQAQHKIDTDVLNRMVDVQQFRDRRMAEKLHYLPASGVLIAGNNHVRKDLGVPLHLQEFNPSNAQKTVTLMLKSSDENIDNTQADYIWHTY